MSWAEKMIWVKNLKNDVYDAFKHKCCKCGYDNCIEALEFHHIDPTEKEFIISKFREKNQNKLVNEVKKCVLLCTNCHRELHAGLFELTDDIIIPFDETKFSELRNKTDNCPVCNNEKSIHEKTCSMSCTMKISKRVDWTKYDLEQMLKEYSISEISRHLGISDGSIHKRLKLMGLK